MTASELLAELSHRATTTSDPLIVFDLDETLINSRVRALRILRILVDRLDVRRHFPREAARILRMTMGSRADLSQKALTLRVYPLHLAALLESLGVRPAQSLAELIAGAYNDLYLSDAFCCDDPALPGAAQFVSALRNCDVHIAYLTGRNAPQMRVGTIEGLQRAGLPTPSRKVSLFMKPDRECDDTEFKTTALSHIQKHGTVIAAFDNEPANINVIASQIKRATAVWVDEPHSGKVTTIRPEVRHLASFC